MSAYDLYEADDVRASGWSASFGPSRVRLLDVALFASQFRALVAAGIPVNEALGLLAASSRSTAPLLASALVEVRSQVEEGRTLGAAFRSHEAVFGRLCVEMIATGEVTGTLERALGDVADDCEFRHRNRSSLVSALIEPALIVVAGLGVSYVLITMTVPQFKQLFASFTRHGVLPLPTRVVIAASDVLTSDTGMLLTLGLLLAAALSAATVARSRRARYAVDAVLLRVPVLGELVLFDAVGRASRTIAVVHRAVGQIPLALELASRTTSNLVVAAAFERASDAVYEGRMLWEAMRDTRVLPDLCVFMTKSGEESGQLDALLLKLAESYETAVRYRKERLLTLLRYGLLLVMGGLVLSLMMAMYMPVFTLIEQLRR